MARSDLQRFGARIRAERERRGLSQEEFAARAGLHRTYLGGVERGERNLGLLNVFRIARALGVPPSTLFRDPEFGLAPHDRSSRMRQGRNGNA
ncbi:MAG TPA: helix-turn-helix transcriptional regulator [Myxococcaceae bacterium]|nr:helix-turn-helix transcriptional regulator [Myxococcaceae bacterium]